jgi:multiple antibiotic resistance protein
MVGLMDWYEVIRMTIGILAIVNPLGAVGTFLGATENQPLSGRRTTANTAAITVTVTLLVAAWVGETVLHFFGIGIPAFRVGGGILVLSMAISMLHARLSPAKQVPEEAADAVDKQAVGVVPLGIPLMSGPGAIALVIVESHNAPTMPERFLVSFCIVLVAAVSWIILRLAGVLATRLTRTHINISTRLMGLILAAIAVEFIASGALSLFPGLR